MSMANRLFRLDDVMKATRQATAFDGLFSHAVFLAALAALSEAPHDICQTDDFCDVGHQKDPGYPCPECAKIP